MTRTHAIQKVLSPNDTGETGGHQAGILIPKQQDILSFFPKLGIEIKNPRSLIIFTGPSGQEWSFSFIYYNNSFFGGTRNEYRLTGMTRFMKVYNLMAGDKLAFHRDKNDCYRIEIAKKKSTESTLGRPLKLGGSWKVIKI